RTLHTLMPALALRGNRPRLVFGTMGADGQLQTQVQLLARLVDDGADPAAALAAPRWVVDPGDSSIRIEHRFPATVVDGLRRAGRGPWEKAQATAEQLKGKVNGGSLGGSGSPSSDGFEGQYDKNNPRMTEV